MHLTTNKRVVMIQASLEAGESCTLLKRRLLSGKGSNQGVSIEWTVVREESTGSWGLRVITLCRLDHMRLLIMNAYALAQYKNSLIPCPISPGLLSLEMGRGRSSGTNQGAFWWTTGFFRVPAVTALGLINFYWRQNHVECAGSFTNLWYISLKRYHERWPNDLLNEYHLLNIYCNANHCLRC